LQQGQIRKDGAGKALIALRGQHKELNAQVADKQKLLEQERRIQSLEAHRQQLQAGDACPLCGSAEHPAIAAYQALDVSATEAALKEKQAALETLVHQRPESCRRTGRQPCQANRMADATGKDDAGNRPLPD
jgi:exonuclease SbcC